VPRICESAPIVVEPRWKGEPVSEEVVPHDRCNRRIDPPVTTSSRWGDAKRNPKRFVHSRKIIAQRDQHPKGDVFASTIRAEFLIDEISTFRRRSTRRRQHVEPASCCIHDPLQGLYTRIMR